MVSVLLDLVRMLTPQFHVGCNEEQTSKRSDGVSLFPNGQLCAGAWEKFQERLPTAWVYYYFFFFSLVCISCVCALRSVPRTSPKNVLSSWSLIVICPLIDTGATGITGWYDNRLVVSEVPGTSDYIREVQKIRMSTHSYSHTWYQAWNKVQRKQENRTHGRKQGTIRQHR